MPPGEVDVVCMGLGPQRWVLVGVNLAGREEFLATRPRMMHPCIG